MNEGGQYVVGVSGTAGPVDVPLLEGDHLTKSFPARTASGEDFKAVDDVSITLGPSQCLAVIGESGSGKTTLTGLLLGSLRPDGGRVVYRGQEVAPGSAGLSLLRRESSVVFQNPFGSLDPRWTVARSVSEPLTARAGRRRGGEDLEGAVRRILAEVHLDPDEYMYRYPVDLSGGQAQRVAIARALISRPRVLLADEPMSAIDVSARVQILSTLRSVMAGARRQARLEEGQAMGMILVSHDLGVVQHIADRILVLHSGRVVETGTTGQVLGHPQEAYTRRLIEAASLDC